MTSSAALKDKIQELIRLGQQITVLFVDDDPNIRESFSDLLGMFFKSTTICSSAQEAIELWKENYHDLVITDIEMPELDGLSMARIIKAIKDNQSIIVLSAHNEKSLYVEAMDINIDGYIIKPLDLAENIDKIITICKSILQSKGYIETINTLSEENQLTDAMMNQFKQAIDKTTIVSKTDEDGIITYVNDAFCEISGYRQDELIGHTHSLLRHKDMPDHFFKTLWSTIKKRESFQATIKNKAENGEAYYVKTYIFPVIDNMNEIEGYFSIRQDITSEMKSQEEQRNLLKMKDEFISNMSHEIKTPLNAIIGFGAVLEKKIDDPKLLKFMKTIVEEGNKIKSITDRLLLISRLSGNSYESRTASQDAGDFFTELCRRKGQKVEESGRNFTFQVECSLGKKELDYQSMEMILNELFENAIKFTQDNGNIELNIRCNPDNGEITIKISDDGIGIAQDKTQIIFDSFSQSDNSMSRAHDGLGVGLKIVQELAKFLDGKVEVESQEGQGSTFTVTLYQS